MKKNTFEHILTQPIYFELSKKELTKPVVVNLSAYNIIVEGKFLVTMEIVKDLGEGSLYFSGVLLRKTYGRETSQDSWTTLPIGLAISVDALVEK